MVKHTDHISRSVCLEFRRISPTRHLLTTKATARLMCSFLVSRLDYSKFILTEISCDQITGWETFKATQRKLLSARACRHEHVRPLLKALHRLPVKERVLFNTATFVFCSLVVMPPYLSSCLSVYTPSWILHSSSDEKNLSCVRWKLTGFAYRSFCFHAGTPCLEQPSCSHQMLQFFLTVWNFS